MVTPLGNDTIMRAHDARIAAEPYDWHDRVTLGAGVAATLVPVRHWSARRLFDRNRALWAGFVIETPAGRIFHVADSGGHHYGTFQLTDEGIDAPVAALVAARAAAGVAPERFRLLKPGEVWEL